MSLLVLEINDAGILASPDDTGAAEACPVSPGYALVEGGRIVTGTAAVECARIKPKHIHNRFWTDLDSSPLSHPLPADLSTADLAHAHLTEIWSHVGEGVTDVILALPGTSSQHQLGLTLGIARACGIPVTGMVDAAVAAAANGYPGDRLLHLDLQLHRVVATELAQNHDIARQRVQISRNTGLAGLHDAWARRVAEIFVGRTRFDPLHSASSEQELYSALLDILGRLGREQRATCELRASGGTRSVELTREDLVGAVAASYEVLLHMARSAS
ncbi:MAG: hypothetical protein ACE5HU_06080, partial [Acidobacteriota bacterium]